MKRKTAIFVAFLAGVVVLYVAAGLVSGNWNPFSKPAPATTA